MKRTILIWILTLVLIASSAFATDFTEDNQMWVTWSGSNETLALYDWSNNSNNLTNSGTTYNVTVNAYYLNGSTYASANNTNNVFKLNDNTISLWINKSSYSQYAGIVSNYNGGGFIDGDVYIKLNNDIYTNGILIGASDGANYYDINVDAGILQDSWSNLVVYFNTSASSSNQVRVWTNGVEKTSKSYTGSGIVSQIGQNNNELIFGYENLSSRYFNGYISAPVVYNKTLSTSEISELYLLGRTYNPYVPINNFTITGIDQFTGLNLSDMNATIVLDNGTTQTYQNLTGNFIETTILTNYTGLANITIASTSYLNSTYNNYNMSSNLIAELAQSQVSFNATELISGLPIVANFTVNSITKETDELFNVSGNLLNVTFSKTGYYNKTDEVNVSALTEDKYTISNVFNSKLNTTGTVLPNGSSVLIYNATITSLDYTYSIEKRTTNGTLFFDLIDGNYSILIEPDFSVDISDNITILEGMNNYTFNSYTINSINFTFKDANTDTLVTELVSLELIGDSDSRNVSTSAGSVYVDLLVPDTYYISYEATGYATSFYNFLVTSRTTNNVTLYMHNLSNNLNVTATVYDEIGQVVENARITVLRHNIASNAYLTDQIATTNFEGASILNLIPNTQYYKFIIEFPIGTSVLATTPTLILDSTIKFEITKGGDPYDSSKIIAGIPVDIIFNNATNNFRYEWTDGSNSVAEACLYLYETGNKKDLINTSCVSTPTGQILLPVTPTNGTSYLAEGYLDVGDGLQFAISDSVEFRGNLIEDSKAWLFWDAMLTMTLFIGGMFISVAFAIAILPLATLIFAILGFINIGVGTMIGLQILFIIFALAVSYRD